MPLWFFAQTNDSKEYFLLNANCKAFRKFFKCLYFQLETVKWERTVCILKLRIIRRHFLFIILWAKNARIRLINKSYFTPCIVNIFYEKNCSKLIREFTHNYAVRCTGPSRRTWYIWWMCNLKGFRHVVK